MQRDQIITDEEGEIIDYARCDHPFEPSLECYCLSLRMEDGRATKAWVVGEESELAFQHMLNQRAMQARKNKKLWYHFWNLKKSVATLKYAYALTAHRAQGSSYSKVFVDASDILQNSREDEARRCLYVAITRPSRELYIC